VSTKTLGPYHVRMRRISQSRVRVHMQLQTRFSPVSRGSYFISYPISSAYINRPTPPHLRRRKYTKGAARLLLPCGGAASLLRAHTHETRRHTTNAASCRYHQIKDAARGCSRMEEAEEEGSVAGCRTYTHTAGCRSRVCASAPSIWQDAERLS
jgi:hypothetical protein